MRIKYFVPHHDKLKNHNQKIPFLILTYRLFIFQLPFIKLMIPFGHQTRYYVLESSKSLIHTRKTTLCDVIFYKSGSYKILNKKVMNQGLYRVPSKGQLGGVAAGLAERFGLDISVMRLISVCGLIFTHGIFFWIYIILWILLPVQDSLFAARWQTTSADASNDSTFNETLTNMKKDSNKVWGIILIILGTIFLLDEWIPDFDFGKFWPLILIAVGGFIIFRDKDKIDFDNKDRSNL